MANIVIKRDPSAPPERDVRSPRYSPSPSTPSVVIEREVNLRGQGSESLITHGLPLPPPQTLVEGSQEQSESHGLAGPSSFPAPLDPTKSWTHLMRRIGEKFYVGLGTYTSDDFAPNEEERDHIRTCLGELRQTGLFDRIREFDPDNDWDAWTEVHKAAADILWPGEDNSRENIEEMRRDVLSAVLEEMFDFEIDEDEQCELLGEGEAAQDLEQDHLPISPLRLPEPKIANPPQIVNSSQFANLSQTGNPPQIGNHPQVETLPQTVKPPPLPEIIGPRPSSGASSDAVPQLGHRIQELLRSVADDLNRWIQDITAQQTARDAKLDAIVACLQRNGMQLDLVPEMAAPAFAPVQTGPRANRPPMGTFETTSPQAKRKRTRAEEEEGQQQVNLDETEEEAEQPRPKRRKANSIFKDTSKIKDDENDAAGNTDNDEKKSGRCDFHNPKKINVKRIVQCANGCGSQAHNACVKITGNSRWTCPNCKTGHASGKQPKVKTTTAAPQVDQSTTRTRSSKNSVAQASEPTPSSPKRKASKPQRKKPVVDFGKEEDSDDDEPAEKPVKQKAGRKELAAFARSTIGGFNAAGDIVIDQRGKKHRS